MVFPAFPPIIDKIRSRDRVAIQHKASWLTVHHKSTKVESPKPELKKVPSLSDQMNQTSTVSYHTYLLKGVLVLEDPWLREEEPGFEDALEVDRAPSTVESPL